MGESMGAGDPSERLADRDDAPIMTGRSFDRFVNFTDAVVAIAITLLVLPLVDIAGPTQSETVWQVIAASSGQLVAYVLAFALIAQNWLVHNRIVNVMRGYDGPVFWLNIGWIAAIALMPWAAAMYGAANSAYEGGEGFGGTGMFFFAVLASLSGFMLAISRYVNRHRYLVHPDSLSRWNAQQRIGAWRMIAVIIGLLGCGLLSLFAPILAPYAPLVVFPVIHVLIRAQDRAGTPSTP